MVEATGTQVGSVDGCVPRAPPAQVCPSNSVYAPNKLTAFPNFENLVPYNGCVKYPIGECWLEEKLVHLPSEDILNFSLHSWRFLGVPESCPKHYPVFFDTMAQRGASIFLLMVTHL